MRYAHRWHWEILPTCAALWLLAFPAVASEIGSAVGGPYQHMQMTGVVSKIRSGIVFVKIPVGLLPRTISPNKADRVGLHEVKPGDAVVLWVDAGNVLLDVHKKDALPAEHRIIAGNLNYADPYWTEITLSTPEGTSTFDVDALAGSKLSVFQEGTPVAVELDADNVMIDIHPAR
jgi:hypothetical protein